MGILDKIADIEAEIAKTQKNKGEFHLLMGVTVDRSADTLGLRDN